MNEEKLHNPFIQIPVIFVNNPNVELRMNLSHLALDSINHSADNIAL